MPNTQQITNESEGNLRERTIEFEDLQMDLSEAVDIEDYLERITMRRLALLAHYNFWQAMEGMCDMPIQTWEWEVSANMRVWI